MIIKAIALPKSKPYRDTYTKARRKKLVILAQQLAAEKGMSALSMRALAELDQTSTQTIYTLFGSKSGLIQAVYGQWMETLEQHMLEIKETASIDTLLLQLAHIYADHARASSELFLAGATDQILLTTLRQSAAFKLFGQMLQFHIDAGTLKPILDIETMAEVLWCSIHGVVISEVYKADAGKNVINGAITIMLNGLKK